MHHPRRVGGGRRERQPVWSNYARTVSSSAATNRAIAGTSVPDADAMMIIARRTRTDPCFPRRTICSSRRPSCYRVRGAPGRARLRTAVDRVKNQPDPGMASVTLCRPG
jgi:hypothetical protein